MKSIKSAIIFGLIGIVLSLVFYQSVQASDAPTVREVTLTAKTFGYTPATFRVNKGDHVKITLKAEDVSHGFYLDGYDLSIVARPKEDAHVEFDANKIGKFPYRCSETCGVLHPFMIGELTVEPNSPRDISLTLAVVVMVGTLAYVKLRKEKA